MLQRSFTLEELAKHVGAYVSGNAQVVITGLGSLEAAREGELSHLSSPTYKHHLADTAASAIILDEKNLEHWQGNAIVTANPYLAFAKISQLFATVPELEPGVDPGAKVDVRATVAANATIGPGVVIGADCNIGADVRIYPNVVIGVRCRIGAGARLMANVVFGSDVRLGARSIVHSGAVVGADGFGFAPDEQGHLHEIAQLGGVQIGEDVSIGACSSIDRGAIEDTVIEDGVKIDNQVQIGHNCHIGAHSILCGCVGIVGSTVIGRHCVLAGGVGVGGDGPIEICDHVTVSGMTHVSASITEPGVYSGGVLHNTSRQWKRNALRFQKLDELNRRVVRLERTLAMRQSAAR